MAPLPWGPSPLLGTGLLLVPLVILGLEEGESPHSPQLCSTAIASPLSSRCLQKGGGGGGGRARSPDLAQGPTEGPGNLRFPVP